MNIIKNIFKAILITIGGTVTIGATIIFLINLITIIPSLFTSFDLSHFLITLGCFIIYIIVILTIFYSAHLFLDWVLTLIEKKRNK